MRRALDVVLFAVLLLVVTGLAWMGTSAAPWMDDWRMCAPLTGRQTAVEYIFAPHNGHLLVLYKAIGLPLAAATGWSGTIAVALSLLAFVVAQTALFFVTRSALPWMGARIAAAILFSMPTSYENMTWAWQLQIHLWLAFTVLALMALGPAHRGSARAAIGAFVAALCALASFGAGMATAAGVGALLALYGWRQRRPALFVLVIVLAAATVAYGLAAMSVPRDPSFGPLTLPWTRPTLFVTSLFTAMGGGAGVTLHPHIALAVGLLLLVGVVAATPNCFTWPAAVQGAFVVGIGACLLFVVGRAGFGRGSVVASRYIEVSQLLVLPTLYGLSLLAQRAAAWQRAIALAGVVVVVGAGLSTYGASLNRLSRLEALRRSAILCVRDVEEPADRAKCARALHPDEGTRSLVLDCMKDLEARFGDALSVYPR